MSILNSLHVTGDGASLVRISKVGWIGMKVALTSYFNITKIR